MLEAATLREVYDPDSMRELLSADRGLSLTSSPAKSAMLRTSARRKRQRAVTQPTMNSDELPLFLSADGAYWGRDATIAAILDQKEELRAALLDEEAALEIQEAAEAESKQDAAVLAALVPTEIVQPGKRKAAASGKTGAKKAKQKQSAKQQAGSVLPVTAALSTMQPETGMDAALNGDAFAVDAMLFAAPLGGAIESAYGDFLDWCEDMPGPLSGSSAVALDQVATHWASEVFSVYEPDAASERSEASLTAWEQPAWQQPRKRESTPLSLDRFRTQNKPSVGAIAHAMRAAQPPPPHPSASRPRGTSLRRASSHMNPEKLVGTPHWAEAVKLAQQTQHAPQPRTDKTGSPPVLRPNVVHILRPSETDGFFRHLQVEDEDTDYWGLPRRRVSLRPGGDDQSDNLSRPVEERTVELRDPVTLPRAVAKVAATPLVKREPRGSHAAGAASMSRTTTSGVPPAQRASPAPASAAAPVRQPSPKVEQMLPAQVAASAGIAANFGQLTARQLQTLASTLAPVRAASGSPSPGQFAEEQSAAAIGSSQQVAAQLYTGARPPSNVQQTAVPKRRAGK